jgi:hypothetical protein
VGMSASARSAGLQTNASALASRPTPRPPAGQDDLWLGPSAGSLRHGDFRVPAS